MAEEDQSKNGGHEGDTGARNAEHLAVRVWNWELNETGTC